MKKLLASIIKTISGLIVILSVLYLTQMLMVLYMLLSGQVIAGDRMYSDVIAPSLTSCLFQLSVTTFIIFCCYVLSKHCEKLVTTNA